MDIYENFLNANALHSSMGVHSSGSRERKDVHVVVLIHPSCMLHVCTHASVMLYKILDVILAKWKVRFTSGRIDEA